MKVTDTISVNPGKTTLGHVEAPSIFRSQVLGAQANANSIDFLKILFPTSGLGATEFRKYELPMRTLFAIILIAAGISMLSIPYGPYSKGFAICTLSFGAFLALGLFSRPLMAGASVFYCIMGALALRNGQVDMTMFSFMFGCLVFCLLGSGKYSCDSFLRHLITSHRKKVENKRKEDLLGYKAFHNIPF